MNEEISTLEREFYELSQKLSEARKKFSGEPVKDFVFMTETGEVKLSELFQDKDELIVIHNMGGSCRYCTLWADGLNGFLPGMEQRAAIVLVSPDTPTEQQAIRARRGWRYTMASDASKEFTSAMGFYNSDDGFWPGASGFRKGADGTLMRTGKTHFGPGDSFCGVWPLFDLIGGEKDWQPGPT